MLTAGNGDCLDPVRLAQETALLADKVMYPKRLSGAQHIKMFREVMDEMSPRAENLIF